MNIIQSSLTKASEYKPWNCPAGNPNCYIPSDKCGGCKKGLCCHNPLNTDGTDNCFDISNCNQLPHGPESNKNIFGSVSGGEKSFAKILIILLLISFIIYYSK